MTTRLPVIVGFGGFGPAGRSSFHHAYRRMVFDSLPEKLQQETVISLAVIMRLVSVGDDGVDGHYVNPEGAALSAGDVDTLYRSKVLEGTLVRRIESNYFDVDAVPTHKPVSLSPSETGALSFQVRRKQLPSPLPDGWQVEDSGEGDHVIVALAGVANIKVDCTRKMPVSSAGQLPTGFDPGSYYRSNLHPRGLTMALLCARDGLRAMDIECQQVMERGKPKEVSEY